jgi:hypothetical protein
LKFDGRTTGSFRQTCSVPVSLQHAKSS